MVPVLLAALPSIGSALATAAGVFVGSAAVAAAIDVATEDNDKPEPERHIHNPDDNNILDDVERMLGK